MDGLTDNLDYRETKGLHRNANIQCGDKVINRLVLTRKKKGKEWFRRIITYSSLICKY